MSRAISKRLRVSFDLDGVAYERAEVYREIARGLKIQGHEIGVLTGHRHESEERVREKMASLGFPPLDFYFGRHPEDMPFNGAIRKSQVICDYGIDLHFDDYDFDYPDTVRLFRENGQESRIARVRSVESGRLG